jgi:hypothetical protein
MRFWLREIAGWLLVAAGLFIFYTCFVLLVNEKPWVFQAGPLIFVGFIVFRGGIHLLKVAVAARICLQAEQRLRDERPARPPAPRPASAAGTPARVKTK